MAKLGSPEQGGYDPFNAISESLSDLSAPAAVETAPAAAPAPSKKRLIPPPPKPVVVEAPQSNQEVRANPQKSSGAVVANRLPTPKAATKTVSSSSALQITKRFKTTRQEGLEIESAATHLSAALGVTVDFSKVTRALWDVYMRHQDDILRNVPEGEVWERPANNDAAGLAELDQRIADLINEGLMVACRRPTNSR